MCPPEFVGAPLPLMDRVPHPTAVVRAILVLLTAQVFIHVFRRCTSFRNGPNDE